MPRVHLLDAVASLFCTAQTAWEPAAQPLAVVEYDPVKAQPFLAQLLAHGSLLIPSAPDKPASPAGDRPWEPAPASKAPFNARRAWRRAHVAQAALLRVGLAESRREASQLRAQLDGRGAEAEKAVDDDEEAATAWQTIAADASDRVAALSERADALLSTPSVLADIVSEKTHPTETSPKRTPDTDTAQSEPETLSANSSDTPATPRVRPVAANSDEEEAGHASPTSIMAGLQPPADQADVETDLRHRIALLETRCTQQSVCLHASRAENAELLRARDDALAEATHLRESAGSISPDFVAFTPAAELELRTLLADRDEQLSLAENALYTFRLQALKDSRDAQRTHDALQAELAHMHAEKDDVRGCLAAFLARSKAEKARLGDELAAALATAGAERRAQAALNAEKDALRAERDAFRAQLDALKARVQTLETGIADARAEVARNAQASDACTQLAEVKIEMVKQTLALRGFQRRARSADASEKEAASLREERDELAGSLARMAGLAADAQARSCAVERDLQRVLSNQAAAEEAFQRRASGGSAGTKKARSAPGSPGKRALPGLRWNRKKRALSDELGRRVRCLTEEVLDASSRAAAAETRLQALQGPTPEGNTQPS